MRFVHKLSQALLLVESECERERDREWMTNKFGYFSIPALHTTHIICLGPCALFTIRAIEANNKLGDSYLRRCQNTIHQKNVWLPNDPHKHELKKVYYWTWTGKSTLRWKLFVLEIAQQIFWVAIFSCSAALHKGNFINKSFCSAYLGRWKMCYVCTQYTHPKTTWLTKLRNYYGISITGRLHMTRSESAYIFFLSKISHELILNKYSKSQAQSLLVLYLLFVDFAVTRKCQRVISAIESKRTK